MKITDKDAEYPNETVAVFEMLKRIAVALENIAALKQKDMERG